LTGKPKIVIVGGGSYCWTPKLVRDIMVTPELEGAHIVLEDINERNLKDCYKYCRILKKMVGKNFRLTATLDEDEALDGADFVILTITTGGFDSMETDLKVPEKYGIYQPVGDTVGPGGLSRALRNIPVVVELARNMERRCPHAWLINITNPMTTLCRAVTKTTRIKTVGLCHELFGFLRDLQIMLDLEDWRSECEVKVAGINHFSWILEMRIRGEDGFEILRDLIQNPKKYLKKRRKVVNPRRTPEAVFNGHKLKFELFMRYGYIPVAGDRHTCEFFPYFVTKETGYGAKYNIRLTTIETRRDDWYPKWQQNVWDVNKGLKKPSLEKSAEAASNVIAALMGRTTLTEICNLPNVGQVSNLPRDVVLETMAQVSADSIQPLAVGDLPLPILGWVHRHVVNQELTVEAALKGDRSLALQALLGDPMLRNYEHAEPMLNEMLERNKRWLPRFFPARKRARKR